MYAILRIDLLVVSAVAGKRDTGFYAVASSLAETVYVACATIALAALPTQTFADERTAVAFSGRFTRAALMIALALGAAMALAGTPLLLVVFGREWLPAAAPLAILCFAVAGLAVADPARTLLVRVGRLSRLSLALGAALAVNVGLVALLVPPLGIVGAAIGSALSYWLAAIALLVLARRHGGPSLGEIFAPPRRDDAAIELVRAAARRLAASGRGSRP
jgi:O-antigen/teichoic acid export membrane protein